MISFGNEIILSAVDLCRNWQVSGRQGSGKSTLLASAVLDCIGRGVGLTLLDPWGQTVDMVLEAIPEEYAGRVRVIRLGRTQDPVPLSLWAGIDPAARRDMNRALSKVLCPEDPWHGPGSTGPDWETWFTALAEASVILFGDRASLDTIALLGSRTDLMAEAASILEKDHADTARALRSFLGMRCRDYVQFRMWAEEPIRSVLKVPHWKTDLGLGENVLRHDTLSADTVTLIDLGGKNVGCDRAGKMGGLLLLYLLYAAESGKANAPHLVMADDVELIPHVAVTAFLESGGRCGLGLILAGDRLSPGLQESAERYCWSYTALNQTLSAAAAAAKRLGDPGYESRLCRLDAGKGYSVLRCGGRMSEITSTASELPARESGEPFGTRIEAHSRQLLSEPWRETAPLSCERAAELILHAKDPAWLSRGRAGADDASWPEVKRGSWVEKWVRYRLTDKKPGKQNPDEFDEPLQETPGVADWDSVDSMDEDLIWMDDQAFDEEEW